MIKPLFDYGDTVWGDRNNQCSMKRLQVLHNKCTKLVLNMKPNDSSTKALNSLHWKSLDIRRKFHRCATIYKSKKTIFSYTFSNKTGNDLHNIQARNKEQYHLSKVRTNWGKQVSSYLFVDDWNILDTKLSCQEILIFLNKGFGQCELILSTVNIMNFLILQCFSKSVQLVK